MYGVVSVVSSCEWSMIYVRLCPVLDSWSDEEESNDICSTLFWFWNKGWIQWAHDLIDDELHRTHVCWRCIEERYLALTRTWSIMWPGLEWLPFWYQVHWCLDFGNEEFVGDTEIQQTLSNVAHSRWLDPPYAGQGLNARCSLKPPKWPALTVMYKDVMVTK